MDLKRFITQSLVEIMTGLREAQQKLSDTDAKICPRIVRDLPETTPFIGIAGNDRYVSQIDYDIAVEASSAGGGGIEGGINVLSASFGGKVSTEDSAKTASRIRFSVPVIYPEIGK